MATSCTYHAAFLWVAGWCIRPFVVGLRWLPQDPQDPRKPRGVEMTTYTWRVQKRVTLVYDLSFLKPTSRPFANFELAKMQTLPLHRVQRKRLRMDVDSYTGTRLFVEEVVAEMFDGSGNVLGRWIVTWENDGVGRCREEGTMLR